MATQDYESTVSAIVSAEDAFNKIANISQWWTKGTTGNAKKLGDIFKVDWGESWVDFEVAEVSPPQKIVWLVTDCNLPWLKDKKEWKGTQDIWGVATEAASTKVTMRHAGLNPALECFNGCEAGWNFYFGKSLVKLFAEGCGLPDRMGTDDA